MYQKDDGANFTYLQRVLNETFTTEEILRENDESIKGMNMNLAKFHPMLNQQIVLYQHFKNIIYTYDSENKCGHIGIDIHKQQHQTLVDKDLSLMGNFKIPMIEIQDPDFGE